ncbi:hypothetical protein [Sphingomonas sp.]|uniref:hypothetical protein n=1 Tax=Sphingomonas sp. TaxID=28214 RepID=UPI0025E73987|nr:hypothetical protein [Sphingomonas sp.]
MTELALQSVPSRRRHRPLQYFFPGMAVFAGLIIALGFVPEILRFAAGTFPIPWVLHIHAGIMFAWFGAFLLQAVLGATGRTALHRRVGLYAIFVGFLAFASMVFVEFRTFVAHPQWLTPKDLDWKLPGAFIYLTFGLFLAWAVRERRRPEWHKRLMTFALFLSLDAAIQRFVWIPMGYGFGPFALALDLFLLVPLFAYDLRVLNGRLHAATVRGTVVLLSSEAALFALWGTAPWHNLVLWVANGIRP